MEFFDASTEPAIPAVQPLGSARSCDHGLARCLLGHVKHLIDITLI
jgi:hypothetical protein